MKKLIILVVLAVAGYFAYQHFYVVPEDEAGWEEEAEYEETGYESYSAGSAQPVPEGCQTLAANLENAIYGNKAGQVSFTQRNTAYRKFRSCLRAEGFSGNQIESTIKELETRVQGYLKQDGVY